MKKFGLLSAAFLMIGLLFGTQVMAQHIELGAAKSAQNCANVTDEGFTASFSFSGIDATEVSTEKGMFSNITMEGTYPSGMLGEPTLPAVNKLLAVPYGAKDLTVKVKSYSTKVYSLADFGIKTLYPQQPMLRKDQKPEDIPFAYNEKAYAIKGFVTRPIAEVKIQGTLRGIQIGALTVNPVQYDAATNSIRVFNDIEVEVSYGQYDKSTSYNEFARTFSPYFTGIYSQMFNWRDDVYDEHPDLWQAPVKMLIIADRMFEECIQEWLAWKTTKGFYVNVKYTDEIGSTSSAIQTFIHDEYEKDAPSFLMIMGDKNQVPASATGSETHCVTDLYYMSVDGDEFADIFHCRFPAETVAQMQSMLNKALEYEQCTMPDPSYLNNVLLIAGEDSGWGVTVGRPTIWYATNYYYNEDHGFNNVYEYSHGTYTGCYSNLNTGVGFVNYTAHGSNTSWAGPQFTVSDVNNLTNEHKYFLAMGNCCEAADWGINGTSFGEAMVRAENKAAYAYIGSCPSTYWLNDYYFGVGATFRADGTMPTYEETTMGCYDAIWTDDAYNSVCAIPFIGNLASNAAQALGYTLHCSTLYCWQAYHVLGDGSIMPFRVEPTPNNVSHMPTLPIGIDNFNITAEPGSYAAISKDGVLYGAGLIDETGSTDITIEPILSGGDVTICVTHPRHIPYRATIPAASMEGAFIVYNNVQCENTIYGAYVNPIVTLKNVGVETANNVTATLSSESEYIAIANNTTTIASIAPDATVDITDFAFNVDVNIPDGTRVQFFVTCVSGDDTWESKFNIIFGAPNFVTSNITSTNLAPGESGTITFEFTNVGSADAENTVFEVYSSSDDLAFQNNIIEIPAIAAGETITIPIDLTVGNNVEIGSTYEISYLMTAGHYAVEGNYIATVGNIIEDFETGDFSLYNWQFGGSANWTIVNNESNSGSYCAKSGTINDNQQTDLLLTIDILSDGTISFYKKVSSENNFDKLYFYIDNAERANWSGNDEWSQVSYPITAGTHTFKWSYQKDVSVSSGSDCAWIDDIQFPPTSIILALDPVIDLEGSVDDHVVTLSWTAPTDATQYIIRRNGVELGNQANTSYTDIVPEDGVYTYSVVASDGNGRYSAAAYVTVNVGIVNVEDSSLDNLSIYPNPANDILNIECTNTEFDYVMFNGMGQMVAKGNANDNVQISVSGMTKSVYFLHIITGTQTRVEKVVVK